MVPRHGDATRLFVDDVYAGMQAPALTRTLTRTDFVRYAGASGDFNPMHYDEVRAREAGQPSVFGHGMLSMGMLGTAITDFAGAGSVLRYRVRFTAQTWPGETLTTEVTVAAVRRQDGNGRAVADLEVRVLNESGEAKVVGDATVALFDRPTP